MCGGLISHYITIQQVAQFTASSIATR